ncbi:MAG: helix-turn-helix transcriptional regulator [Proteobacteria bacterium]|nr:helix-turn-helix transcriptional regulator [Pseudomonadota bacterium]
MPPTNTTTFGSRLRAERVRLNLTQEEFAGLGGVKRVSQHLYEQDVRVPDVNYLLRLQQSDVNVAALILDSASVLQGMQGHTGIPLLMAAFRAVDEFARDDHGDPLPLPERERFFRFLCMTLSSDESTIDSSELQHRLVTFLRSA